MVSTKGRYALRMMIDIAKQGPETRSSLREVAERQQISIKYLEQLASPMVSSGLLKSIRGPHGGYLLGKEAQAITAADIVAAAEGDLAPVACLLNHHDVCPRKDTCETIKFWAGLQDVMTSYMTGITLADLIMDISADLTNNLPADHVVDLTPDLAVNLAPNPTSH